MGSQSGHNYFRDSLEGPPTVQKHPKTATEDALTMTVWSLP